MTNARGKPQKHRLADMTIQPVKTPVWQPYREGTSHESFTVSFDASCSVSHQMWFDGAQLVDFVMTLQFASDSTDDDPVELVRVDCAHGQVHVHRFDADNEDDRTVIVEITCPEDLQSGADAAETLIYDNWESFVRRWEYGR